MTTPTDTAAGGELADLFRRGATAADRLRALKAFGTAIGGRLKNLSTVTDQAAEILTGLATRLPIRTREQLEAEYGADPETTARRLIEEASKLGSQVWTAAAIVPGPPPVVHAAKVIAHSAIEIRLVAELYALHGAPDLARDQAWMTAVLDSWATGRPVAPAAASVTAVRDVAVKVRQAFVDLAGGSSRVGNLASRGQEGVEAIERLGWRLHRRMRLDPSTWEAPSTTTAKEAIGAALLDEVRGRGGRVAGVVAGAVGARAGIGGGGGADAGGPTTPKACLAQAWDLHGHARSAAAASPADDPAALRLQAAIVAQEKHLRELAGRLRSSLAPASPAPDAAAEPAHVYLLAAEEAIDRTEAAAHGPRRLASWPARGRNALVYALTALVVSVPTSVAIQGSDGWGSWWLILVQVLLLPWVALALGAVLIGRFFRPWLGGRVPRSPFVGAFVSFAVLAATAVGAALL